MVRVPTDRAWPENHAGALKNLEFRIRAELEPENRFSRFAPFWLNQRPHSGEYSQITDFIWSMLTKTADSWIVVVPFDLTLTVFYIPNPNLVSLFQPVNRLVSYWRFSRLVRPCKMQPCQNTLLSRFESKPVHKNCIWLRNGEVIWT